MPRSADFWRAAPYRAGGELRHGSEPVLRRSLVTAAQHASASEKLRVQQLGRAFPRVGCLNPTECKGKGLHSPPLQERREPVEQQLIIKALDRSQMTNLSNRQWAVDSSAADSTAIGGWLTQRDESESTAQFKDGQDNYETEQTSTPEQIGLQQLQQQLASTQSDLQQAREETELARLQLQQVQEDLQLVTSDDHA